jgi:uncharacterized protein YggE
MKPVLASLSLLLCVGLASANITVTGSGKVTYTPDLANLSVGVSSDGQTAAEAWDKNRAIVDKLFEVLKANGIDAKDMKTSGLSVTPKYLYVKDQEPKLVGYTASYDLTVTVRRLDDLGKVLDGLVDNGANRNVSIGFGCSDPEKLLDEARAKAVAEAHKKADIYATGAGASLGLVQDISEGSVMYPRQFEFERFAAPAAADKSLAIAAGQQEMTVQVTVTYALNHNASGSH